MNNTLDKRILETLAQIVHEAGSDHTAPAIYGTQEQPKCIIGVLCKALGMQVPQQNHIGADMVFAVPGVSTKMRNALRCAQVLNDRGIQWGRIMKSFGAFLNYDFHGGPLTYEVVGIFNKAESRFHVSPPSFDELIKAMDNMACAFKSAESAVQVVSAEYKKKDHALAA